MMIMKKAISRRTMLKTLGAAVPLPLLDAMVPAMTAVRHTPAAPEDPVRHGLRAERRHPGAVVPGGRRRLASSSRRRFCRSSRSAIGCSS
jgi:hypothetical protein